jgi:hypothetical protein
MLSVKRLPLYVTLGGKLRISNFLLSVFVLHTKHSVARTAANRSTFEEFVSSISDFNGVLSGSNSDISASLLPWSSSPLGDLDCNQSKVKQDGSHNLTCDDAQVKQVFSSLTGFIMIDEALIAPVTAFFD